MGSVCEGRVDGGSWREGGGGVAVVIIYLCFETKSGSLEPRCRRSSPP